MTLLIKREDGLTDFLQAYQSLVVMQLFCTLTLPFSGYASIAEPIREVHVDTHD